MTFLSKATLFLWYSKLLMLLILEWRSWSILIKPILD